MWCSGGTPRRHKGAKHWAIRRDGEDGVSLLRDTPRSSQFIAFQTCRGSYGASSVPLQAPPPWGRWAPCLHPFWVRRHLLGCLGATRTPESSPVIPALPPRPLPQSRVHPQGRHLPEVQQVPPLSAPALKRGLIIRPSATPSLGCPERLRISIQTQHSCPFPLPSSRLGH